MGNKCQICMDHFMWNDQLDSEGRPINVVWNKYKNAGPLLSLYESYPPLPFQLMMNGPYFSLYLEEPVLYMDG